MLLLVVMSEPSSRHGFETDGERAAAVAVTDEPEEQARLLAGHRIEAHLVDQQEGAGHVFPALDPGRGQMGVDPQRGQQFVETEILDREAELDGPDAEAHEQMRLSHPGRALHQDDLGVPDPGAGRQGFDPGALDRRLEGEVEGLERLTRRDLRGFQHGPDAPLLSTGSLRIEEAIEKDVGGQFAAHGLGQQPLQSVHGVPETEQSQLVSRRVDVEPHARGSHRATSANWA
jgi:hypothetical protein